MSLTEPWQFAFFRYGIAAATLAGALCALVGTFVVLRNMSYIGHGLSHAIFGGAVASYAVGVNFYIGAGFWGVISALIINGVARRRAIGSDAAIGIVTTAAFAIGVAIISRGKHFSRNFEAALFGNVLGVNAAQIAVLSAAFGAAVLFVVLLYKRLVFVTFDPEVAATYGIRVGLIDAALSIILAATIISSMQVLGVTLIAATLVIPAVIARLLTNSFKLMLAVATVVGAGCGFIGMYASYYLDIASGATIVLVAAAAFVAVFAVTALSDRRRIGVLGIRTRSTAPVSDAAAEIAP